jgi:phage portal protein BeeE
MEYVQTGMDNTDAQYIETRGLQNSEIWRIFRMPPHKVGDLEKATFSNIEQQGLEYVTDCLMSELVRWEQTLKRDLLLDSEQDTYFFEFLTDALLAATSRAAWTATPSRAIGESSPLTTAATART